MVDGRRHRDRARRRPAALAAALTATVTVGAAGVVAVARDGGAPASVPESLDRPAATAPTGPTATTGPTETTGSAATAGPAATAAPQPTRPAPVAAGTLQAPATRTGPPVPAGADTGNPVVAVSVAVGSGWRSLERTDYGYWVAASGAGPGPYQVRLTDDRGHTATATVPLYAGATVATGVRLY